jgi:hypothetical protein
MLTGDCKHLASAFQDLILDGWLQLLLWLPVPLHIAGKALILTYGQDFFKLPFSCLNCRGGRIHAPQLLAKTKEKKIRGLLLLLGRTERMAMSCYVFSSDESRRGVR